MNKQQGSILPLTLIILAILINFAFVLSQQARISLQTIQQQKEQWQTELEYRSTLQKIIHILLAGKKHYNYISLEQQQLFIDGRTLEINQLQVQIQEGAGLLGLSVYQPQWFSRLLTQKTDKDTALKIRDQLSDWMDKDHIRQRFGMEASDYLLQKKDYQPPNRQIRHLDELLKLPTMTTELYNQHLRQQVLAGGVGFINVATATEPVLKAVFNLSPSKHETIINLRKQHNWKAIKKQLPHYHLAYNDSDPFAFSSIYRIKLLKKNAPPLTTVIYLKPYNITPYLTQTWYYPDNERGWSR